jgi:hypothetical protein
VSRGGVRATRGYNRDFQRQSSSSGREKAELSRTTGLSELEEMGGTAVLPPSREELGIRGNGELGYDLEWDWTLE